MILRRLFVTCPKCKFFLKGKSYKWAWAKDHRFCPNCGYFHVTNESFSNNDIQWKSSWDDLPYRKEIKWWNPLSWFNKWELYNPKKGT